MRHSKDLSNYRIEKATDSLKEAVTLLNSGQFHGAANRSYYCIFHCMRAVLALEDVDYKKHSSVISHFRKNYIKTNIFNDRISQIISDLFELRNKSDYDDFFIVAKQEVVEQVANAEYFLKQVKAFLGEITI